MPLQKCQKFIEDHWDKSIIPALQRYIHIPNKSPMFDPEWRENGHMHQAVKLISDWCLEQDLKGMKLDVIELENRTPLIFIEIEGNCEDTILLYGHLDKQPEMQGWDSDLAPWKPVIKGDKLYGRGGADDGYAAFASITAIKALQNENIPHARCIIMIEACEESGSYDLPFYIDALEEKIGQPDLVICLDSGCGNYDQLWMTTSLRGIVGGILRINVLREGLHSGNASGIVPSCFLVLRQLIAKIENKENGEIILSDLQVEIPDERKNQAKIAATILGDNLKKSYPLTHQTQTVLNDNAELILNRTWRSALSIIGLNGVPNIKDAGNVTLPSISLKLSMRIPPTLDHKKAAAALKNALENNPPFDADVSFEIEDEASGWNAPTQENWLKQSANSASNNFFNKDAMYMGEGGSIPFMGMLGLKFPQAQFVITGLLGPGSNAHGPNEFLHIPTGKKLTCCVAQMIADHFNK